MDITLTDAEHALILGNMCMQLQAMGHTKPLRHTIDIEGNPMYAISIFYDFCTYSCMYHFNDDGSTTEDILFKIGDSGFQETLVYPNDTRSALVERLITCAYSFWPDPKESQRLQDEWLTDRTTRLKEYLKNKC